MKNWVIYIITHGPIYPAHYQKDFMFNNINYKFFNVSKTNIINPNYSIINRNDINYIDLGKWWAESEAIYNIYKSGIYKEYDYIGFVHYDYDLDNKGERGITAFINSIIQKHNFISFSTYNFRTDYNQHIMMDEQYPNTLVGPHNNCWNTILNDYNQYYGTSLQLDDLWNKDINLCCSFLSAKSLFENFMGFLSHIIESKKLDIYDTEHKHRFQGGMMERYIGMYTSQVKIYPFELTHLYNKYK